jgi:hypothetical protein
MKSLGYCRLVLGFVMCASAQHSQSAMADDEIRSGCGGGITGGSAGVALSREGHLWNWQRSRADSGPKRGPLVGTHTQAAIQLFERAKLGGFPLIQYRQSGNMTCWVELSEDGNTHGVYWSDPSTAPSLAVDLFDALQKLQRAVKTSGS